MTKLNPEGVPKVLVENSKWHPFYHPIVFEITDVHSLAKDDALGLFTWRWGTLGR